MEQPTVHALNWFEIPVRDLNRASAFYEALLATALRRGARPSVRVNSPSSSPVSTASAVA